MEKKQKPGPKPKPVKVPPMTFFLEEAMKAKVREIALHEGRAPSQIFKRAMVVYCKKHGYDWPFEP